MTTPLGAPDLAWREVQSAEPPARMAFRFTPATVRAILPPGTPGTYLLLDGRVPVYVGRSDRCLRTRLGTHNHFGAATHLVWETARTPADAFRLESFWFHRHHHTLLNRIHPAPPAHAAIACPFCADERDALHRALGRHRTAAAPVVAIERTNS